MKRGKRVPAGGMVSGAAQLWAGRQTDGYVRSDRSSCGVRCQAARRRTSQTEAAMRIPDSATSQPASMSWKCQNRLAGS